MIDTATSQKTSRGVLSLQVLRGVAAVLVVVVHSEVSVTIQWPSQLAKPPVWLFSSENLIGLGAAGVDIFFLISGFIMVYVSPPYRSNQKPSSDFLIRRLIRIYPMYALTTIGTILVGIVHFYRHPELGPHPFSTERIIASFSFVPTFSENGLVQPILTQGWTLFYEMFFYACFAVVLKFSKRHLLVPLVAIFGAVLILARVSGMKNSALSGFLSDTIMIEFLFGCGIGLLFQRNAITSRYSLAVLVLGIALFVASVPFGMPSDYRFLVWGLPASLLLVSILKIELAGFSWPRPLLLIGDASYSIYLVHVFVISQFRGILTDKAPQLAGVSGDVVILTLVILAVAFGVLIYQGIEKPINSRLSGEYSEFRRRRSLRFQIVKADQ